MSEQAQETVEDDVILDDVESVETEEAPESLAKADGAESDEIEIVVDGEDEPPSKPSAPKGFHKRIHKLNSRVDAAKSETEEERREKLDALRRAEALEEENKLLRSMQGRNPNQEPKPEDFESDDEFEAAKKEFDDKRVAALVEQKLTEVVTQAQTTTTRQAQENQLNGKIAEHLTRAEGLKVSDYESTEDVAIDALGRDFAKQVMAKNRKSELILYHIGKNPGKAEYYAELAKSDPVAALMEIGELGARLKPKPKHSQAPDPDTTLSGAGGIKPDALGPPGATFM